MPRALKLTIDNVDAIIAIAKEVGFDLSHLYDSMEFYAVNGCETYLIADGSVERNNLTFTDMPDINFHQSWKFQNGELVNQFAEITRI